MTADKAPPDAHLEKLMDNLQSISEHLSIARMSMSMGVLNADEKDLAAAKAAIREYLTERTLDTQRLDWVIENGAKIDESNSAAEDGEPWICRHRTFHTSFQGEVHYVYAATAREAIDKAVDAARRVSMKEPE